MLIFLFSMVIVNIYILNIFYSTFLFLVDFEILVFQIFRFSGNNNIVVFCY